VPNGGQGGGIGEFSRPQTYLYKILIVLIIEGFAAIAAVD
jgi:hypothetical protein